MRVVAPLVLVCSLIGCGRGPFWELPVRDEPRTIRCSKVDFLYVIDDSESMRAHQENLRASFGPFIEGMQQTLEDVDDYHVGVVTSDRYNFNENECRRLGALVTRTGGRDSSHADCGPFAEGQRYMTQVDDLEDAFNCTAAVGTFGSRAEKPMEALENAISGEKHWYDDCNEGFIRDDALLVTVIITDEWDGPNDPAEVASTSELESSEGTPASWFRTVASVKGTERNAVVVSLLNEAGTGCETTNPAFDGRHIADFTRRFTHGFVGGICEPDYGDIFADAVDEIDVACDEYQLIEGGQ